MSTCRTCAGTGWAFYAATLRWHGEPEWAIAHPGAGSSPPPDFEVHDLCSRCYGSGVEGGTESFCGCPLADGAWGLGGFHQYRRTVQETLWWACVDRAREDSRTMKSLQAYSDCRAQPADTDVVHRLRSDVWRSERAGIVAASGKPWAFERCGAYQAATFDATNHRRSGGVGNSRL